MQKNIKEIITITCEESSKGELMARIKGYLIVNDDYDNGNIELNADEFETVKVIIYEGCKNIPDLVKIFTK